MKNNSDALENFAGIFPNAASKEYCDKVIHRYEYLRETQLKYSFPFKVKTSEGEDVPVGRGKIYSSQEGGRPSQIQDMHTYNLGGTFGDNLPLTEEEKILMRTDAPLLQEFTEIIRNCYEKYTKKYRFLTSLEKHAIATSVRIQKYKPTQGFHIWHCDGEGDFARRMIVVALYLNTVKEGGETEFLHQSIRVPPVQGTVTMWPAGWTHAHRGNPPLKEDKYLMTTWLESVEHQ